MGALTDIASTSDSSWDDFDGDEEEKTEEVLPEAEKSEDSDFIRRF